MGANNQTFLTFIVSAKIPPETAHRITKCDVERFLKHRLTDPLLMAGEDPYIAKVKFNVRRDFIPASLNPSRK